MNITPANILPAKRENWFQRMSVRTKFLILFLLVSLLPMIGFATLGTLQTQQALNNAAELSLRAGAAQTAASIDAFIESTLDAIRVEAQLIDFVEYLNKSSLERLGSEEEEHALLLLRTLSRKDPINIISYALIDETGVNIVDTVRANIGGYEGNEEYFKNTLASQLPYVTSVLYNKQSTPIIHFSSPVRNPSGKIIGILRVEYNSAVLQQLIAKNATTSDIQTSIALVDDFTIRIADSANPTLIQTAINPLTPERFSQAVSQKRLKNTTIEEQTTNYPEVSASLQTFAETPYFSAELFPEQAGLDAIALAPMQSRPWVIIYSQPVALLLGNVRQQISTNLFLLGGTAVIVAFISLAAGYLLTTPINHLAKIATEITSGNLAARAQVESSDEIGTLATTFNSMANELQSTLVGLEKRVSERTAELERSAELIQKRASQLEAISDVARSIASLQDIDKLLPFITKIVSDRFGFYHIGIFLNDESNLFAILRAANSPGGQQMLARNHRLKIGQEGIVGYAISNRQARIALDVGEDAIFFNNPDLPTTRSEIALPLMIGGHAIGALDVQSEQPNAFSQQDVEVLSTLAYQVAVAIQNANLFEQARKNLDELRRAFMRYTQGAWQEFQLQKDILGYRALENKVEPIAASRRAKPGKKDGELVRIPVQVRGITIGNLGIRPLGNNGELSEDQLAIAQAAADRVGLALESARLFESTQRRAATERAIGEVSSRLSATPDIDDILRLTIEELGKLLADSDIAIQINTK